MTDTTFQPRNSVIDAILEQGKRAMRGGSPILYIKTDSDVLINQIVTDRYNPLVLLTREGRPHTEWDDESAVVNTDVVCGYKEGLPEVSGGKLTAPSQPTIWVQKLPEGEEQNSAQERDSILRKLEKYVALYQDEAHEMHELMRSCVVLLYAQNVYLTPMLKTYATIIDVEYPDEGVIRDQILAQTGNPAGLSDELLNKLISDLRGFSGEEICALLRLISGNTDLENLDKQGRDQIFSIIRNFKKKNLEGGLLEIVVPDSEIGGMENYCADLDAIVNSLENTIDYRRMRGVNPPKGDLLTGIQGCGKSALAKYAASKLRLTLLKLDMGKMMNKYVGESERQLRATIKLAESMAPCMLFFDELEKALAGNKKGSGDDAAQRMFGYLLGWMQEHTAPVYIFATSNDITGLPKELFRTGRFRNRYAVFLPTEEECISIFKACMRTAEKIAAKASGMPLEKVCIFGPGCDDEKMLRKVICTNMIRKDGTPRIMIGSDIQEIVDTALRSIPLHVKIDKTTWEKALHSACSDRMVEGDSEENVENFAVSYCRLLRKGFRATSKNALFDKDDYHIDNQKKLNALREQLYRDPKAFEGREEEKKAAEESAYILQRRKEPIQNAYDRAVYECLFERINDLAPLLERKMREMLTDP